MAKVLIVDDDPQLLRMVGMILERGSHQPLLESNPLQAIERIREERPGLVILDVMMPELSGHDLTAQIRADEEIAATPILIVTARSQSVDREAALASGAQYVSTDYVWPDERFGTGYVVDLPGDDAARCNPVNAPRRCHRADLSG